MILKLLISVLMSNNVVSSTGCPPLSLTNGTVTYSNSLLFGSVANYTCDVTNGYVLTPGSPTNRTCTMNGWTGDDATCERKIFQLRIKFTYVGLSSPDVLHSHAWSAQYVCFLPCMRMREQGLCDQHCYSYILESTVALSM